MDPFEDTNWEYLIDYDTLINDVTSTGFCWTDQSGAGQVDASLVSVAPPEKECTEKECSRKSAAVQVDASLVSVARPEKEKDCTEKECSRKRGRENSCSKAESKACRERQRREMLNKRFLELSSTLEPDRPATTDKLAILGDAIRVLNQLKSESQDFKDTNEKLLEEIKTLKAEKNELREEKLVLKAEKEKMEQQVKAMTSNIPPPGYMAPHPAAFPAGANKMPVFPGYGYIPMWQYLPQSTYDTSHDHELRPPAA